MRRLAFGLVAIAIATIARADVAIVPPPTLPSLSERLPNGLTVIVSEDPSASSVALALRYDGGAAADDASHAGYAHLVEELARQGSVHVKAGEFDRRIDAAGGFTSSTTEEDHVSFATQVPAGAFDLALWLEAERMAGLADGITDEGLAHAREVIATEYRGAYEDTPYALADREVEHALRGPGGDIVVAPAVLAKVTRADVRAYVHARFVPANATLAITGPIDVTKALSLAQKYFGWIPAGKRLFVPSTTMEPLHAAVSTTVHDATPKVIVAYRTNLPDADDTIALEVAARVLEAQLREAAPGADVHVEVLQSRRGGELRITATPSHGADGQQLAAMFRARASELGAHALSADAVRAATAELDLDFLVALESLGYRADALAAAQPIDLHRGVLKMLSPDAVQRAAAYWLADRASVTVISAGTP